MIAETRYFSACRFAGLHQSVVTRDLNILAVNIQFELVV
jgi:hypothetical protein